MIALKLPLLLAALVAPSRALDNGLAITPPLGWRSWVRDSRFRVLSVPIALDIILSADPSLSTL